MDTAALGVVGIARLPKIEPALTFLTSTFLTLTLTMLRGFGWCAVSGVRFQVRRHGLEYLPGETICPTFAHRSLRELGIPGQISQ